MLVLLDRDGVLNVEPADWVKSSDELVMIEGAAEAVARLNAAGHRVVVVTNQSVVGRGIIDQATLESIHDRLRTRLAEARAHVDEIISCFDPPWAATARRKPGPAMLCEALARCNAVAETTPLIGDALTDLEAASAAGCQRILVRTGKGRQTESMGLPEHVLPVSVFDHLAAAIDGLLRRGRPRRGA